MKIFMTGGTGFIGKHVAEAIGKKGHEVVVYTRQLLPPNYKRNIIYVQHIPKSLTDFDKIYHLAGVLGKDGIPEEAYEKVHVALTANLLSRMNPKQHFIFMGTAYTLYPQLSKHKHYIETKQRGENLVKLAVNNTIIKPGFVYGPGDMHHRPVFKWIIRLGRFFPIPGSGKVKVCPTFVHDVAEALIPEKVKMGQYHIAGNPITINDFVSTIAEEAEVSKPFIHIPPIIKPDFFNVERIFPNDVENTNLAHGIRQTIFWYRQRGLA